MSHTHRLDPGRGIHLADIPTNAKPYHQDRDKAEKQFKALREEFVEWQRRLYAADKHRLLIVLQAMDAGGKDGTIRRILQGVNPQGVLVHSFKKPSEEDLAHDFLWRIHQRVPGRGMITLFNRSHYEDVLVVRVDRLVPEAVWQARYEQINQFEKLLADTGTTILKFYLHISKAEQQQRFTERIQQPEKNWKFSLDDLNKRAQWEEYMAAYEAALNNCTTPWAPWYVIPADQKWYRNLAIMNVIVATLRELNPQYPVAKVDLSQVMPEAS